MKDIDTYNEKGQPHGYWETYWFNGQLNYKGNYINGKKHGYWEEYWDNGNLFYKGDFVNDRPVGYFEIYEKDGTVPTQIFFA